MNDAEKEALAMDFIAAANARGIPLCLLGGLAVRITCRDVISERPVLSRPVHDLDFASYGKYRTELSGIIESKGLQPRKEVNILFASSRQIFDLKGVDGQLNVDIMFDRFKMCHEIPLEGRLEVNQPILFSTDLILTKLQIYHLTRKDGYDLIALILHDVYERELNVGGQKLIEDGYVGRLCAGDWGLWRTTTGNLRKTREIALKESELTKEDRDLIAHRITRLEDSIRRERKSWRWKLRSAIGERVRWYDVPEDI